jgi:hypothetical protein
MIAFGTIGFIGCFMSVDLSVSTYIYLLYGQLIVKEIEIRFFNLIGGQDNLQEYFAQFLLSSRRIGDKLKCARKHYELKEKRTQTKTSCFSITL